MQPLAMYQKRILKNGIVGCGEGVIFHIFGSKILDFLDFQRNQKATEKERPNQTTEIY